MKINQFKTTRERRRFIEKKLDINLKDIGNVLIDDEERIHCENLIGAISLPLGVAGPIRIQSNNISGEYYIPLATTEGALVASINRGCKAILKSGGVNVISELIGATRGPVFKTSGLKEGSELQQYLNNNFSRFQGIAVSTSSHIKLLKLETQLIGNYVFARLYFDTKDAMGMNMVTIATDKIIMFIESALRIKAISVAGNFDIDKKPAWQNFISGRGKKVNAECIIKEEVVKNVLKTTSQRLYDVWLAKCMIGSALSGSLGFNSHFANIIAAFFTATGQDLAHITEGSMGITITDILRNNDLYIAVYLPDIMVGTVGGGTNLNTQTQALNIIGVKKSMELADVLAGAIIAGELFLLASLSEGSLAKVHQKLGR